MKIVVTGGMGFIGSNFIRMLLRERPDWSIVNLDLLTYAANPENLADVAHDAAQLGRYSFVQADIAEPAQVAGIVDHTVDAVINFAAESHVDRSIECATPFLRSNVIGTQVLLDSCRQSRVPRFVQVSTDEVYGDLEPGDPPFSESTPISPSSPYSASKAAADHLVLAACRTHRLDAVVTRCSNNYGRYQFPEKLIPLMIVNALEGADLPVYGRGENVRDWIAVEDHCRGLLAALERGSGGEVYNFGGASERRNIDVVHEIVRLVGASPDRIRYVTDRPGHDRRYAIDFTKARNELGWSPLVTFEEGLAQTVTWYLENREWWSRVRAGAYRESISMISSWDPSSAKTSTVPPG